jgi:hypothetical protein
MNGMPATRRECYIQSVCPSIVQLPLGRAALTLATQTVTALKFAESGAEVYTKA